MGDSLYGIDVSHILSFSDSFNEIKYANQKIEGFIGYLDFRNTLVRVFDCATVLSQVRERDSIYQLISDIKTYQQAHVDWVAALEHSIITGEPFTKPRNPRMCAFGQWFYSFKTKDDSLKALLEKIEDPHLHIHALADRLLEKSVNGQNQAAIEELGLEKQTTLKKLLRVLENMTEYLQGSIHPIVLHLTEDGTTPAFSMVLDDIGDIIDYSAQSLDKVTSMDRSEPIHGYVREPSGTSFMMLSLDKLHDRINSKVNLAG
jgi:chemotaxis signal transduction protein